MPNNPFYVVSEHPRVVFWWPYLVSNTSLKFIFLLFAFSHALFALLFSVFVEVSYSGPKEGTETGLSVWWYSLYYCFVVQISPGFTEFVPTNDQSRVFSVVNGFVGLIINAFFISLLISRAIQPKNIFEICPFLIINVKKKLAEIRLYSKFPGNVYDIEFSFYRFLLHQHDGDRIFGRTEEIEIRPSRRKMLRSRYPYIVRFSLSDEDLNWDDIFLSEGEVRRAIPMKWLAEHSKFRGHFYLYVKAETNFGSVYQIQDYELNPENIVVGESKVVFEDKDVDLKDWYDFRRGNWKNWNKVSK